MNRRKPTGKPTGGAKNATPVECVVDRLGTEGIGLAQVRDRWIGVPDTLPGETVRIIPQVGREPAILLERLTDSPDRIIPACRHFGTCGGCALQHLAPDAYAAFKRRLVCDALSRNLLPTDCVAPAAISPSASRRRARFAAMKRKGLVTLGFHARASHDLVDLGQCPVMAPAITEIIPKIRDFLTRFLPGGALCDIIATASDTGLDLGLLWPCEPDLAMLETLAAFAHETGLARLWWQTASGSPVPAAQRTPPQIRFGSTVIDIPCGPFLQATASGEAVLIAHVRQIVGSARRIADLYAGCGTFTLALADPNRTIIAIETDAVALTALKQAAHRAGYGTIHTEKRDLEQRPLVLEELKGLDCVILDPPRAGAKAMAETLSQSSVPHIAYVSCNPASFARDAAILVAGGYQLDAVWPVDQFLWSPHIELVAQFSRTAMTADAKSIF